MAQRTTMYTIKTYSIPPECAANDIKGIKVGVLFINCVLVSGFSGAFFWVLGRGRVLDPILLCARGMYLHQLQYPNGDGRLRVCSGAGDKLDRCLSVGWRGRASGIGTAKPCFGPH